MPRPMCKSKVQRVTGARPSYLGSITVADPSGYWRLRVVNADFRGGSATCIGGPRYDETEFEELRLAHACVDEPDRITRDHARAEGRSTR